MKCSECSTAIEKSLYFALEHDAHDVMRVHGGYVYFWAANDLLGENTFIKIGFTSNLEQRLAAFTREKSGVLTPDDVRIQDGFLYGVISGGRRMEHALHLAFDQERVLGEWFLLSDRLAYLIDVMLDEWCADPCCSEAPHLERRATDVMMREAFDRASGGLFGTLRAGLDAWDESEQADALEGDAA